MTPKSRVAYVILSLILAGILITAGCTIDSPAKKAPVTPARTPNVHITPVSVTLSTTPTPAPVSTTVPDNANAGIKTCAEQKGTILLAGQVSSGSWLPASDTFSCYSGTVTRSGGGNTTVVVEPLDFTVNLDDDPGTILAER